MSWIRYCERTACSDLFTPIMEGRTLLIEAGVSFLLNLDKRSFSAYLRNSSRKSLLINQLRCPAQRLQTTSELKVPFLNPQVQSYEWGEPQAKTALGTRASGCPRITQNQKAVRTLRGPGEISRPCCCAVQCLSSSLLGGLWPEVRPVAKAPATTP